LSGRASLQKEFGFFAVPFNDYLFYHSDQSAVTFKGEPGLGFHDLLVPFPFDPLRYLVRHVVRGCALFPRIAEHAEPVELGLLD
jgi:hypothetical protein